jgi:hypothetical protein
MSLAGDLMVQLELVKWPGRNVGDAAADRVFTFAHLCRGWLFTVFASLYEGRGLPGTVR